MLQPEEHRQELLDHLKKEQRKVHTDQSREIIITDKSDPAVKGNGVFYCATCQVQLKDS